MREDIRRIVAFLCALCLIISGEGRLSLTALADVIHPAFSAYAAAAAGTEHDSVRAADAADDARTDDDAVAYAAADTGHDEDSAAETVLSENVLTMEWDIYRVKVRYGKEAGIPDDARLVVRELTDSNDPDYSDYIAAGADTAGVGADSVGGAKAFDISVRSDETGEEYQPSSDMKVEISIPSYYIRDDMQIDVVHFAEKQAEAYSPVLMDVRLSDKMLIIIHLMGNHIAYHKRYPAEFNQFKGEGVRSEYDNSILYNDYVMKELVKKLSAWPNFKGLVYVSDHSEGVAHDLNHNPDTFVFEMAYIPLYMYFSEAYQQKHPQKISALRDAQNYYFTNDLIFNVMLGIMDIQDSSLYEADNDLTSPRYNHDLNRFMTMYGNGKYK